MAKSKKPNKTALVKEYLASYPDAAPRDVADALSKHKITAGYISNIKLKMKKDGTEVTRPQRRKNVPAEEVGQSVVAAASLIKMCGSVEEARKNLTIAEGVARVLK